MKTNFIRDAKLNFLSQAVYVSFGVISLIFLARVLGPEDRGHLAVSLLIPNIVFGLVANGFSTAIIYFVAGQRWRNEDIMGYLYGLIIYLNVAMAVVMTAIWGWKDLFFPNFNDEYLAIVLLIIPLNLIKISLISLLSGRRNFKAILVGNLISIPLETLFLFCLVLTLRDKVFAAMFGHLVGLFMSITVLLELVRRKEPSLKILRLPILSLKKLQGALIFGGKSHLGSVAQFFNYRADQILVNIFLGTTAVGIYAVTVQIAERLWLLVGYLSGVVFPAASETPNSDHGGANFTARLAALVLASTVILGFLFNALSEVAIKVLFGSAYLQSAGVLVWLLPGIILLAQGKIICNYLAGKGYTGINASIAFITLFVNLGLNWVLIPFWGLIGVATATSVSYIIQTILSNLFFSRITKTKVYTIIVPNKSDLKYIVRRVKEMIRRFQLLLRFA